MSLLMCSSQERNTELRISWTHLGEETVTGLIRADERRPKKSKRNK